MEPDKFETFISERRKELNMTRAHLTDRAISKRGRCNGYPDITNILPLAETLDL
ncbi:MAG: hypothetical protein IKI61_04220 [Erysipelotrichaceae bacterium]|nr:hypothetical protein [Erysipelotrichaceae bacterium]